jgi:hypothetical protein
MEAPVLPLSWGDFPNDARDLFAAFRSPAGEDMVLRDNVFIEAYLIDAKKENLSEADMAEYRRPFLNAGEDRRPMLSWPRQIPLDGSPPEVERIKLEFCHWLRGSAVPKLVDVRVCDADRYSPGSAAAKANRSPTCSPSTSTMRRCSPCRTHTASPALAGTTMWVGLFLNSTTPIQLAVTTATFEGLPGVGVDTIYHPGRGAPTCDRRRPLIDIDECPRRCQIASAAASFMDTGTPAAVLTKNSRQRPVG